MNINKDRPLEELDGPNARIIRHKLGWIHCCTPLKEAFRECRPKGMRKMPVALRRGWVKFVADTHQANFNEFAAVTSGRLGFPELED